MSKNRINLKPATLDDKSLIYSWFTNKDILKAMLMGDDYPDNPVPDEEAFFEDYEDYYFDGSEPEKGRVYLICLDDEPIGSINYSSFHLHGNKAELDIWMKSIEFCGKGYGSQAIKLLCDLLKDEMDTQQFIIRPSKENINAIKAYEKAGFIRMNGDIEAYKLATFIEDYGDGDYGIGNDLILIRN